MNKKVRWMVETAVLIALLVALQAATSGFGQFVTGSCVNAVLAVAALFVGLTGGLVVALVSPVCAFLLGIAPNAVTVPAIMAGNAVFVVMLALLADKEGKNLVKQVIAWLSAAAAKFAVLYALVVWIICGLASAPLLESGVLKQPMLQKLPAMFSWPQLVTALIGGGIALAIVPVLKKALKR